MNAGMVRGRFGTDAVLKGLLRAFCGSMFDEYKSDTSVLVTIPIAKQLVEASGDFKQYQKKSSDYLESVHYTGSYDLDYREMQTFTSPLAYPVWGECMKACATNRVGLFAWKEK
jgi:hypothetical protein